MKKETAWLLQEKYNGEKSRGFFADCARLEAGEPLAYVIGFIPFLNTKIWLDNHPLIPRPETEYWVEHAIKTIREKNTPTPARILDLCAGSGCIGVAVAKALPEVRVDFAEIDPHLSPTIKKNITENLIDSTRCTVYTSDLFSRLPKTQYDFILSNPPYIDPLLDRTEPSVKNYEPHRALYGGETGSEVITTLIATAKDFLTIHGQLWIEHEPEHVDIIYRTAAQHGFTAVPHPDQYKDMRYSILVLQ